MLVDCCVYRHGLVGVGMVVIIEEKSKIIIDSRKLGPKSSLINERISAFVS